MQGLWQLLYLSRCAHPFTTAGLLGLARQSQATNAAVAVTGLLMFDGAGFIQLLEGPEAAVRGVFGRIAVDPRHRDVTIAMNACAAARQFDGWSMKCRRFTGQPDAEAGLDELMADLRDVADPHVRALFTGFARRGQLRARLATGPGAAADHALDRHLDLQMAQARHALDGDHRRAGA